MQPTQPKYIGYVTPGVKVIAETDPGIMDDIVYEFDRQASHHDDWFYEIEAAGHRFFVCDNGEDGYTAMLPEEY